MVISAGYFYHISDRFFVDVNDSSLMSNKENNGYRPHFLAIQDDSNNQIYWMIPVSSKYQKYAALVAKHVAKYGKCTKIVLGKCGDVDAAYLIQNAFPITCDYFDHIHTNNGIPLTLHQSTSATIVAHLRTNLRLHKKGVNLFFADIDRLYKIMETHLT